MYAPPNKSLERSGPPAYLSSMLYGFFDVVALGGQPLNSSVRPPRLERQGNASTVDLAIRFVRTGAAVCLDAVAMEEH